MSIILITLIVFGSSFFGTIVGFGTSMILEPILFLQLTEPASFLISGVLHFANGLYRTFVFRKHLCWDLIASFALPGALAAALGSMLLVEIPIELFVRILGVFLIGYVVFLLIKPRFTVPQTKASAVAGGLTAGFFAGLFGVRGALRAVFLSSYDLEKEAYMGTSAAIALTVDAVRLLVYLIGGMRLTLEATQSLVVFILASLLGVKLAQVCVPFIPQNYFRPLIALVLLAVGFLLLLGL